MSNVSKFFRNQWVKDDYLGRYDWYAKLPWYAKILFGGMVGLVAISLASWLGITRADAGVYPRFYDPPAASATLTGGHVGPFICRPEPPDYPGCTREQVLPFEQAKFTNIMTGHETYYRYWEMGEKPSGHLLDTISPALDDHLAAIWWDAYLRAKDQAAASGVAFDPMFKSWAAFRNAASAGCPSAIIGLAMPWAWCSASASGYTDADWRGALWDITRAELGCGAGAAISWRMASHPNEELLMAAGKLKNGYWEAVGLQTTCVAVYVFNKLYHFIGKGQP